MNTNLNLGRIYEYDNPNQGREKINSAFQQLENFDFFSSSSTLSNLTVTGTTSLNTVSATTIISNYFIGDGSGLSNIITGVTNVGSGSSIFNSISDKSILLNSIAGGANNKVSTTVDDNTINIDINEANLTLWPLVVNGNTLISGGASLISGLTFSITPLTYIIGSTIYEITGSTELTLTSGDSIDNRIDVIIADISGNTSFISGESSPSPAKPEIDPSTQIEITFVTVLANSTGTTVTTTLVYDEKIGLPSEWDYLTNSATINGDSVASFYSGTKSIEFSTTPNAKYFELTASTPFNTVTQNVIQFAIKNKVSWPSGNRLRLSFRSESDVQIGNIVDLYNGRFGFSSTNTSSWQIIAIPISNFNLTTSIVSKFRILTVSTSSKYTNVFIDYIRFQEGIPTVSPVNQWMKIQSDDLTTIQAGTPADTLIVSGGTNLNTTTNGAKTLVVNLDNNILLSSVTATTFYGSGSGLTGVESSTNLGRILFVALSGNDSTAIVGNLNKPYATLKGARDAAISGDTIYVFPQTIVYDNRDSNGNYWNNKQADMNLWKDGITYYFMPGTKIILYNQTPSGQYIYLFKPLGNAYETCTVLGYLDYEQNSTGPDSSGGACNFLDGIPIGTDLGFEFYAELKSAICNTGEFIALTKTANTPTTKITIKTDYEYSDYNGGQSNTGGFFYLNAESTLIFNSFCKYRDYQNHFFHFYLHTNNTSIVNFYGDETNCTNGGHLFYMGNVRGTVNYNVKTTYYNHSYTSVAAWGAVVSTRSNNYSTSNFIININSNLIDVSPSTSTVGVFYINTLNNVINFNGSITTNTISGVGRFIATTTSNTYGNTININGNINYNGTGATTNCMFQPAGTNTINYTGKITGNYVGPLVKTYNGNMNINNSYIKLTTTAATQQLLINGGTVSGTCSINNSYVELKNDTIPIYDGSYVKTLINNSTIANSGSGDTLSNITANGTLQLINSMIYSNNGNSINYSTAPVTSFGSVTNTPYTAATLYGSLATLTDLTI